LDLNIVYRARICKHLWSPGIDSEESISPAYENWRAGTKNRVVVPARQAGNRFLVSLKGLQIPALKPQVCELSRLCPETSTKFYSHEFGVCCACFDFSKLSQTVLNPKVNVQMAKFEKVKNPALLMISLKLCDEMELVLEFAFSTFRLNAISSTSYF
jgi:hypothetical protein